MMLQRLMYILFVSFLLSEAFSQALPLCDKAIEQGFYSNSEGWLYHPIDRQEEFALQMHPNLLPYLSALGQAFADNGITVVAALLPTRAMVYPQELDAVGYDQEQALEIYQHFRNVLNADGFLTPDLLYRFRTSAQEGEKVFFKLDHHWTPEGSRITAEEIASTIKTFASYQSLEKSTYSTGVVGEETYRGSRITDLEALCGAIDISDEPFNRYETVVTTGASGSLFGDVGGPAVVYVGTSNGEDTMNFPGNLRELLGLNVLKANMIGGATFTALQNFLYSNDYQNDSYRPNFLIWELNINTTILEGGDILGFSQPLSYRQLIPSLYGQCENDPLLQASGQSSVVLDANELSLLGSRYYLSIFTENPALTSLTLQVKYKNGEIENLTLQRPSRLTSPNRFFLEFSDFYNAEIASVEISAPEDTGAGLQAQVCDTGHEAKRPYSFVSANLTKNASVAGLELQSFDQPEVDGQQTWRWGLGDKSTMRFIASPDQAFDLNLEATSPIENQLMDIVFNGQLLEAGIQVGNGVNKTYRINSIEGANVLEFHYAETTTVSSTDTRPLAVVFQDLRLQPAETQLEVMQPATLETTPVIAQPVSELSADGLYAPLAIDLARTSPEPYNLTGASNVEADTGRWLLGPSTTIAFNLDKAQALRANLAFNNPIQDQTIEILFNGQQIDTLSELPAPSYQEKSFLLSANQGMNQLEFRYADWNQNRTVLSQTDTRPMAAFLTKLELLSDGEVLSAPESITPIATPNSITTESVPTGDLISYAEPQGMILEGISELENGDYRWALGPETKIGFTSDKAEALEVEMALFNPIEGQSIIVTFNGAVVQELGRLHQGTEMNIKFYVNVIPGDNSLVIRYSEWNGSKTTFASKDTRPLAVLFKILEIRKRN